MTSLTSERDRTWFLNPDLLSTIDMATGTFDQVNPAWTSVLGWSMAQLQGKSYEEFVHPDDIMASLEAFEQVREGNPVLRFENRYRTKAGDWCWLSWVAVPDNGKLYSSTRDITDEKRRDAELALRTIERDRLWNVSQDLMGTATLAGRLVAVNPAWTWLLGWSEEELLSRPFLDIVHPSDHAATGAIVQRLALGEDIHDFVDHVIGKDGQYWTISWTASPERGSDLFLIVGRDITLQRRMEEQLRQSQKMEAVGQLTGGLAHDFNNILAGITGSLEIMHSRLRQGRTGELERYIIGAQGAAKRAASLTHRLLAFSRRQTLDPKPTDVNALINGMLELIHRSVGPEIQVNAVGAAGLWLTEVDQGQLENSLLNLCINARDAMPEGGKLTIETANSWLDHRTAGERGLDPGQYVSLSVSDTGTGMEPVVVARAFDPFFTTKPIGQGTGLGLSMVYGFAGQSGGSVRIYSEVGKGTSVCIYLPRHIGEVERQQQVVLEAIEPSGTGQIVLLVDDEPLIRVIASEQLDELGYHVLEAPDARSAMAILTSDRNIDLLITDVGLPDGMNGRQLADAARSTRPDLPVLFITGYAENAVLNHGHLARDMHVMTKPFQMDVFARRIREVMRKWTVGQSRQLVGQVQSVAWLRGDLPSIITRHSTHAYRYSHDPVVTRDLPQSGTLAPERKLTDRHSSSPYWDLDLPAENRGVNVCEGTTGRCADWE